MVTPRQLSCSLTVFALAAVASAQLPERSKLPFPAPQADVKTPAPIEAALPSSPEAPRTAVAAVAPAPTEDEQKFVALPAGIDFSEVRYQTGIDGALWARGASYKMSFTPESATLVPFFSSRAPRNFDIAFNLRSVAVGGSELALLDSASVRQSGDVVTLDHGNVDELYELGLNQVEQKFVIESLPKAGALVLRLGATTELAGCADEGGFTFANDWGRVTYGAATAIDAAGRKLALESVLDGGEIRIVVPAEFTATAVMPIVIDPVLAIFGVDVNATASFSGDSSYDLSGGGVMHCYTVVYSANDYDVGAYATDRWGNVWSGSFGWTDFTSAHWVHPRIAHNGATDRFLIAAMVGQPNARLIYGAVRSVWTNPISGPVLLSGPEAGEKLNVDVGGDPYGVAPSFFLIVYERVSSASDHEIHARLIDPDGQPNNTVGTIYVDNSAATLDVLPTVSKSNDAGNWNIAWQRNPVGGPEKVYGARVLWQGSVTATTFQISSGSIPQRAPSVSTSIRGTNRFVVAVEKDYSTDNDIWAYAVNGNVVETSANVSGGPTLLQDQRQPAIDCDGAHFMVAYSELSASYDVYASELEWTTAGLWLRESHMALATTNAVEGEPQVASAESSNPNQNAADYTVIYNRGVGSTAGTTDDVFAALVVGSYGGEISTFCGKLDVTCPCGIGIGPGACPNSFNPAGAHLTASGYSKTTADNLTLTTTGMPPNKTSLLFQGTGLANFGIGVSIGDGMRCVGGAITRFTARANDSSGNSSYPQPGDASISVRGGVPLMGGTYYYQTWYRDPTSFCTSGATNLSDGLKVIWTP